MKTSSKMSKQTPKPKPLLLIIIFIFFASCIVIAGSMVYALLQERLWIIVFFGISLLIASAVGTVLIWQWQGTRFYRERYETDNQIKKLNRVYAVLSNIDQAIVRIHDSRKLLDEACRIAVEKGKFRMAWIGMVNLNTNKVEVRASDGNTGDYLKNINIDLSDETRSMGPTGRAVRSGEHFVSMDIANDDRMIPWKENALRLGYRSSIALPIKVSGAVRGAFNLYSGEVGFFDEDEIKLLDELAMDISFGLEFIERETKRKKAEQKVMLHDTRLKNLLDLHRKASAAEQEIFDFTLEASLSSLQSEFAFVGIMSEDESVLTIRAWSKGVMDQCAIAGKTFNFPIADLGLLGEAVRQRRPIIVNDYETSMAFKKRSPAGHVSIKRFLCVPIFSAGRIVVVAATANKTSEYNESDVTAFTSLLHEMWNLIERKQVEQVLRESEARFRLLVENAPDAIFVQTQYRFAYMNSKALKLFGAESFAQLIGQPVLDRFHPSYHDIVKERIRLLNEEKKIIPSIEQIYLRIDNTPINVELSAVPIHWEGHDGAMVFFRDITERKQTEEKLRYHEHLLREMGRIAKIGGWEFDPATGKGTWTEEVARIHELDPKMVTNVELGLSFYQAESRAKIETAVKEAVELGKLYDLELELTTAKGNYKWVRTIGHPVIENGKVVKVRGSFQDITERKKLEEQLLQSQKMESIGTLAGGVAHDFNNILTTIIGFGNLTLMKMAADDPLKMHIKNILDSADRAAHLTQSLLAFSRKQLVDKQPVDLNTVLKKAGEFLKRVIGEHIECKINLQKDPVPVLADSTQLEQVMLNFATNARDAMPKGGLFKITAEQVMLDDEFITFHGFGRRGQYALITVEDTGTGMDENTRQRIFEPFFTTKEVGKGTGLGLAMVYGIVKQHDGYINVYSEPGKGAAFKIYLPIIESKAKKGKKTPEPKIPQKGAETILLAEDDENLRKLNLMMFEEFGYTVIEAVDGEDAVRKFKENKDIIQLLLFDLIMPKKSGKDAYDEIAKIKPDIKAIFISGYSSDMIGDTASLGDSVSFIQKPVTPNILLKKVRSVLDE